MIRLGLRLTLGSGREAALRVLVTAAAVALGVGLLLAALAGVNGLHAQTDRGAWLDTSAQASPPTSTSDRLWWLSSTDQFGNQAIDRVDVAAAGPNAPVPPGIPHLPGPGEYYASPALTTLLRVRTGERAARPVSGATDRDHRRSGAAVPELADHRHRPHRAPALAGTWCGRGRSHPTHAGQLLRLPERHRERTRSAVHPGRRSRRALAAGADLDRDREPAVGRAARGALRRDAARRRHAASDFGGLRGGGGGRGGRGRRSRLRTLLRLPTAALPRAVHRSAPRPRRPLAALDRHRARRDRRPGRRCRVRAPRASQGPDIAARREPASVVPPTADRTDHPAARRHRRARVLRRGRQAGQQSAASFSSCSWASCSLSWGWFSPDRGSRPRVLDSWRSGPVAPPRSSPAAGSSTIPRRPSGSSVGS